MEHRMTVRTIDDIFRDFVIDGVPASGPFNPHKPDIRDTLKALLEGISTFPDNRVIRLNNADEGTGNNIVVTASVPIPAVAYQVLYILNVTQENTGPVTVSGAINRTLVTNTSRPIEPGYLRPGMALLCIDNGTELRLLSYGDAEAIQEAAEAAADRAEVAAEAAESAVGGVLSNFDTRSLVATANILPLVNYVRTAGYSAVGDGGGALYKRVAVEPSHAGKVQSADGAWWELAETEPNVKMFGAIGDGVANDQSAIVGAVDFAYGLGMDLHWPHGDFVSSESLPNFHNIKHSGPGRIVRDAGSFHPAGLDANLIFVDASVGNDTNDGLSSSFPFQTLNAAVTAVFTKRRTADGIWTFTKGGSTSFTLDKGRAKSPSVILIPGDFPDMASAFNFLRLFPVLHNDLIQVRFQAGYIITTGVAFRYDDFSRIEIVSDDAVVPVGASFVGVNITSDPFEANSLLVAFQSKAPRLNCLIDMQTFGGCGVVITNNSDGYIAGNKGVRSAGAYGLYVNTRSSCIAANANFRLAGWGNRVTTNSLLEAPQCDFSQARNATYLGTNNVANLDVSRGSVAYVTGTEAARTNLQGGKGHGLAVRRSFVSATHVDCSQNEQNGVNAGAGSIIAFTGSRVSSCLQHGIACDGSRVDANETTIINNGSHNLYADSGGEITARNVTCGGAGINSVRAANGSRINVSGGTCRRGGADDPTDIVVTGGSIVHATGATGGTNIPALTFNVAGLIFK